MPALTAVGPKPYIIQCLQPCVLLYGLDDLTDIHEFGI